MRPFLARYVRNSVNPVAGPGDPAFDCIVEPWFRGRAAFETCGRWGQSNEGAVPAQDEKLFKYQATMRLSFVDEREEIVR